MGHIEANCSFDYQEFFATICSTRILLRFEVIGTFVKTNLDNLIVSQLGLILLHGIIELVNIAGL